jgi:hypothetical protein
VLVKELTIFAGVDYKWAFSKPNDGSTPQLQMELTQTGVEKIATVFGPKFNVTMTHEQGEPERVTVRLA